MVAGLVNTVRLVADRNHLIAVHLAIILTRAIDGEWQCTLQLNRTTRIEMESVGFAVSGAVPESDDVFVSSVISWEHAKPLFVFNAQPSMN